MYSLPQRGLSGLQIMTTKLPHPCLHITFPGKFAVSFITICHSTCDPGIRYVTCFDQLDISKYNASRSWKVIVS